MINPIQGRLDDLEHRIIALENENEELYNQLEAVSNELAYVDAYQENLQIDLDDLINYIEDLVN
jgi:hypothetical protein